MLPPPHILNILFSRHKVNPKTYHNEKIIIISYHLAVPAAVSFLFLVPGGCHPKADRQRKRRNQSPVPLCPYGRWSRRPVPLYKRPRPFIG